MEGSLFRSYVPYMTYLMGFLRNCSFNRGVPYSEVCFRRGFSVLNYYTKSFKSLQNSKTNIVNNRSLKQTLGLCNIRSMDACRFIQIYMLKKH